MTHSEKMMKNKKGGLNGWGTRQMLAYVWFSFKTPLNETGIHTLASSLDYDLLAPETPSSSKLDLTRNPAIARKQSKFNNFE